MSATHAVKAVSYGAVRATAYCRKRSPRATYVTTFKDSSVAALLLEFSGLSRSAQATFLDALNFYMYASPQQRAQQRAAWRCRCVPDEVNETATGNEPG